MNLQGLPQFLAEVFAEILAASSRQPPLRLLPAGPGPGPGPLRSPDPLASPSTLLFAQRPGPPAFIPPPSSGRKDLIPPHWQGGFERFRAVVGAVVMALTGLYMLRAAEEGNIVGLLVGVGISSVLGKWLLGPFLASFLADRMVAGVFGHRTAAKPEVGYSIPEAHRQFRRFEEAIGSLQEILLEEPEALQAWEMLIEIAYLDLNAPERARLFFLRGLKTLKDPAQQTALRQRFQLITERWQRQLEAAGQPAPALEPLSLEALEQKQRNG